MTTEDKIKAVYGDALQKIKVLISKIEQRSGLVNNNLPVPAELNTEILKARNEFEQAEKLLKTV